MSYLKVLRIVVLALFLAVGTSEASGELAVTSWSLQTLTYHKEGTSAAGTESVVTFPFNLIRTVTDGASTATTAYDFSASGNEASFSFQFDHDRDGGPMDASESCGSIWFSTSENLPYALSGMYALQGSNYVGLCVYIDDVTTGERVFWYLQDRAGAEDPVLILGEHRGTLQAGHDYRLWYDFAIMNVYYATPDDGEAATGWLDFIIPEPGTLSLLALGGLALLRRRR